MLSNLGRSSFRYFSNVNLRTSIVIVNQRPISLFCKFVCKDNTSSPVVCGHPTVTGISYSMISNKKLFSTEITTSGKEIKEHKSLSTTKLTPDDSVESRLMAFFDDEKNWKEEKVKSGRPWTKEDLRIKSNSDLHKLWYVLLKERNMLLTMEYEAKKEFQLMPSPERLDKVEESMKNLEEVVKERNRAYHLLETGETGERKVKIVKDGLGLWRRYAEIEHAIPEFLNSSFRKKYYFNGRGRAVSKFITKLKENQEKRERYKLRKLRVYVRNLLVRFPDIEDDLLAERYPGLDIKKLRKHML